MCIELEKRPGIETELIDAATRPDSRRRGRRGGEGSRFAEKMNRADAVVLVAPEYNRGYLGLLKHVLDTNLAEYIHKAVGVVGVSAGIFGEARMIENLLPVLRELGLVTIFWDVNVNNEDPSTRRACSSTTASRHRQVPRRADLDGRDARHGRERIVLGEPA